MLFTVYLWLAGLSQGLWNTAETKNAATARTCKGKKKEKKNKQQKNAELAKSGCLLNTKLQM